MQKVLVLPDLGFGDQPITVSVWLVKRGDFVKQGEPIVEILCGPATVDLPAPIDGVVISKPVAEDEQVTVGQTLAVIENSGE